MPGSGKPRSATILHGISPPCDRLERIVWRATATRGIGCSRNCTRIEFQSLVGIRLRLEANGKELCQVKGVFDVVAIRLATDATRPVRRDGSLVTRIFRVDAVAVRLPVNAQQIRPKSPASLGGVFVSHPDHKASHQVPVK